jgi:hypothetical protein
VPVPWWAVSIHVMPSNPQNGPTLWPESHSGDVSGQFVIEWNQRPTVKRRLLRSPGVFAPSEDKSRSIYLWHAL